MHLMRSSEAEDPGSPHGFTANLAAISSRLSPALRALDHSAPTGYTDVLPFAEPAMRRKPRAPKQIVAFKVDPELASILDAMPNKSEFIRSAVQSRLATACPLCRGTGVAPFGGITDELTKLVQQHPIVVCTGCGIREPRPCHSPGHCEDDPRVAVFERWGAFYCAGCFSDALLCTDCLRPLSRAGRVGQRRLCDGCKAA